MVLMGLWMFLEEGVPGKDLLIAEKLKWRWDEEGVGKQNRAKNRRWRKRRHGAAKIGAAVVDRNGTRQEKIKLIRRGR